MWDLLNKILPFVSVPTMPYRRRYKRRYKRKSYSRRSYGRRRRSRKGRLTRVVIRSPSLIPDVLVTRLVYCDDFTATPTGLGQFTWRANALDNPAVTLASHQPMGYDQLKVLYSRTMVFSTSMSVTVINNHASEGMLFGIVPADALSTPWVNLQDIRETPYAKTKMIGLSAASQPMTLFSRMATKKIRGVSKLEEEFGAAIGANPDILWYWHFFCQSGDFVSAVDITVSVKFTFWCKFYKRITIGTS